MAPDVRPSPPRWSTRFGLVRYPSSTREAHSAATFARGAAQAAAARGIQRAMMMGPNLRHVGQLVTLFAKALAWECQVIAPEPPDHPSLEEKGKDVTVAMKRNTILHKLQTDCIVIEEVAYQTMAFNVSHCVVHRHPLGTT